MNQVSRRSFLKVSSIASGGFILGFSLPACGSESSLSDGEKAFAMNSYVQVEPSGMVTITVSKPDMGQGVRTSLAMIVAEEMGVDWKSVKVVQAPGDRGKFGSQGVGGSGSIRGSYMPLRRIGAAAALMIKTAAAKEWGVAVDTCSIENGFVISGDHKEGIGKFAQAASTVAAPDTSQIKLKETTAFSTIGKPTKRIDNIDVVTGKAVYGIDVRVPEMVVAVIARPQTIGGSAKSFDDSESKKVNGFEKAFKVGSGVAVVAASTWTALKAKSVLSIDWDSGPNMSFGSEELDKKFEAAIAPFPDMPAGSQAPIEAKYHLPYLAHAPMEPLNCTAFVHDGKCEIWVPTQVPDSARDGVARQLGITPDNVTVNVTLLGGGFGRRLLTDYITEAVAISKEIGKPVQLLWTREDDIQNDKYRPATYHALKGAVDSSGMPIAFYHQQFECGRDGALGGWKTSRLAYTVANNGVAEGGIASPVPTFAWRSVENTYLNLINECFFDELCAAGKQDPVATRIKMLKNDRLKATLVECAKLAEWEKPLPKGQGRGVACFAGYGSFITQIAEVMMRDDGTLKVVKVTAVVDCGLAINPLGVQAQVQGATMDGVSTLLHSAITVKEGAIEQVGWSDFGWGRMEDSPAVNVHVISNGDSPGGIGEVGFPASGPAILNAIFAATGKRLRRLPIGTSFE